ncbi:glycosyltransferase family protein [Helicobacter ailurogastricus]|uniref:glycosyltransferase family protein n=1 Tax=Helicobacter ailurogastricus TaxID=1578720 RepID=UPI000CF13F9F|nr:glycosyltransferase [Helicobacter ailurogastricus]
MSTLKAKIRESLKKIPLGHACYKALAWAYHNRFFYLNPYLEQYVDQRLKAYDYNDLYGDLVKTHHKECEHYAHLAAPQEVQALLEQRGFNAAFKEKFKTRKPFVLFAGNDEHQDKSGFIQDLEKLCEKLTLFTKADGSYGTFHYGYQNGTNRFYHICEANSYANTTRILEILDAAPTHAKPDLLIIQGWGWNYTPRDLLQIKHRYKDLKILNLQMDDRFDWHLNKPIGTHAILPFIDCALSTAPERVRWILQEGTPAFYMPLASSLEFYHPLEGVERIYDIGFVGANVGVRGEIIKALEQEGFRVRAYGYGFGGRLPLEETNLFFNQCELVLGCGSVGVGDFVNMKLRDFDAPMSGAAYITTHNKDLELLFRPDSVIFYQDIKDLIQKAHHYLTHKEELVKIRENAFKEASQKHTYEKRLKEVFKELGCA